MKITLDHNCIIDLLGDSDRGSAVRAVVDNPSYNCFVVNVGASEMQPMGLIPGNYATFEQLLEQARIAHLPRLNPMGIWGITFWDHCIWGSEEMSAEADALDRILFNAKPPTGTPVESPNDPIAKKAINRLCDVHTMWCHIHYGNEVFCTSDRNFLKELKRPKLIALGAKAIRLPAEL